MSVSGATVQLAGPSAAVAEPLRVAVRRVSDLAPVEGIEVRWEVLEGAGIGLSSTTVRTDSAGLAAALVVLGPQKGRYRVRARAAEASVEFELWAVDAPVLESAPASARTGDTLRLGGRGLAPVPGHAGVLFGTVRARVVRSGATELAVEVPSCLPEGVVAVRVRLGEQWSAPRAVRITGGASARGVAVGEALTLRADGEGGEGCQRIEGGSYLLVLGAAGTVGGARYPVMVAALPIAASAAVARVGDAPQRDAQGDWDRTLREWERSLLSRRGPPELAPGPSLARAPSSALPVVGERREFQVLGVGGGFRTVRTVARHVSSAAVFYEDIEAPAGHLTAADFAAFGAAFDDPIEPTVSTIFGRPSDLDGNQRVIVLFTPAVNQLTERASRDGFIGGFFYGLDLLSARAHSNGGEIFYALVPDPEGRFGDPRSRELVLSAVPIILAHEFTHMVHFAERVLARGAAGGETVWLAEALAEMAEDRVGDAYAARGQGDVALAFQSGNRKRARLFLEDTGATSLITAAGAATLAERGASWLFLRYVAEGYGGNALLRSLTQTTRTGVENVRAATGRGWPDLMLDWGVAMYDGDEPGVADPARADPRHRYLVLRPREALTIPGQEYPLRPRELVGGGPPLVTELPSGGLLHLRTVNARAPIILTVGGYAGVPVPAAAGVTLRVVRLR